jgi:hypothetical protein
VHCWHTSSTYISGKNPSLTPRNTCHHSLSLASQVQQSPGMGCLTPADPLISLSNLCYKLSITCIALREQYTLQVPIAAAAQKGHQNSCHSRHKHHFCQQLSTFKRGRKYTLHKPAILTAVAPAGQYHLFKKNGGSDMRLQAPETCPRKQHHPLRPTLRMLCAGMVPLPYKRKAQDTVPDLMTPNNSYGTNGQHCLNIS